MYDIPAGLIVVGLLVATVSAIEAGYRIGLRRRERTDEPARAHIHLTETSTLGLLALLIAFSFSLALQRYDTRSDQVVDEANAVGTAYLRIDLLPAPVREDARRLMREYVDLRVKSSRLTTTQDEWRASVAEAPALHSILWAQAMRAAQLDPSPVTSGLYIQALNEMFDSFGRRDAGLNRHVPEMVLFLLFGVFLVAAAIVGFASGSSGHRPPAVSLVMVALIVLLVYVVLDLDRPRRGLIEVPKQSLYDLQASIHKAMGPAGVPTALPGATAPASSASR